MRVDSVVSASSRSPAIRPRGALVVRASLLKGQFMVAVLGYLVWFALAIIGVLGALDGSVI